MLRQFPLAVRVLIGALLGLQLLVLGVITISQAYRVNLGVDFSFFSQAWTLIGQGHLNPPTTIRVSPYLPPAAPPSFLSNHFELIMWPLGLLYPIFHSAMVLRVIQLLAVVGTSVLIVTWSMCATVRSQLANPWRWVIPLLVTILLVINPTALATVLFDFHFESLACFFVAFAGFDLWRGRTGRLWVWIVLTLLCGDLGGLYVVGLGLSALLAAKLTRRWGAALVAVGITWLAVISVLGDNQGSEPTVAYAYLAGRSTLSSGIRGVLSALGGAAAHPSVPSSVLWDRHVAIGHYLASGGIVGFFTPWGFGVSFLTLLTSALFQSSYWILLQFQNFAAVPFIAFGTATALIFLVTRRTRASLFRVLAGVLVFVALSAGVLTAIQTTPVVGTDRGSVIVPHVVSAAQGSALRAALAATPPDAEVIASNSIVGGFSQRSHVYELVYSSPGKLARYGVHAATMVMVIDTTQNNLLTLQAKTPKVSTYLVDRYGARVLVHKGGVLMLLWHPPAHQAVLRMP
jgi:uncharacterized membrane protein